MVVSGCGVPFVQQDLLFFIDTLGSGRTVNDSTTRGVLCCGGGPVGLRPLVRLATGWPGVGVLELLKALPGLGCGVADCNLLSSVGLMSLTRPASRHVHLEVLPWVCAGPE